MVHQLTNSQNRRKRKNLSCETQEQAIKTSYQWVESVKWEEKRKMSEKAVGKAKTADRELITVINGFISGNLRKVGARKVGAPDPFVSTVVPRNPFPSAAGFHS